MTEAGKRQLMEKFQGVYFREHATRKHHGKPDRCFDITFKMPDGKKIWEKIGWTSEGYTAQMAAQVRAERLRTIRHGEELPSKKKEKEITFGEVWEKYEEWGKTNLKRFCDDKGRYTKHLEPVLKDMAMSEINPFLLEKIKSNLLKDGKAPATVKHVLIIVREVFNKAVTWNLWSGANPVKGVKLPKLNNARERFLSKEEASKLLDELAIASRQTHDIAYLSLYSGMRAGEIFGMKWADIDFTNAIIGIPDPKGGRAQKVYMSLGVKAMLAERRTADAQPDQLVFPARGGGKMTQASDAFDRAVKRLGFNDGIEDRRQKVCFHTLRHTFASWLALKGTPILTIKNLMRHSSLSMTERYAHLCPSHEAAAVNGLDETPVEATVTCIQTV